MIVLYLQWDVLQFEKGGVIKFKVLNNFRNYATNSSELRRIEQFDWVQKA